MNLGWSQFAYLELRKTRSSFSIPLDIEIAKVACIYIGFPILWMLHIKLALIGQAVSEKMFEYYGNKHVYCPGVGPYKPLGPTFFQNH